jgi:hypothetical protein
MREKAMNEQELAELFRKLGAEDPEGWARSQIREGIPQLARYLFLRQAWRRVIGPDDRNWILEELQTNPAEPGGDIVPALKRLLAAGASEEDLTTVVRVMQWRLLARLCVLLEDPGDVEPEVADMAWQLFLIDDENGTPIAPIGALIESVLETDPTGRYMMPVES